MRRLRRGLLLGLLVLAGCGGREEYPITGAVTYDGEPVTLGAISFVPLEPGAHPDAGKIEQGRYRVLVTPGKKRVKITASRPLPSERQTAPEMGPLYEDYLPAEFNSASTLTAEIAPRDQELNFDLAPTMPHE